MPSASDEGISLGEIPREPPIEIIKQGQAWVVGAYDRGRHTGATYSTHDSQIDAVRAAKSRMDEQRHPCVLRWESPESVRNIYWNPLFERLDVTYDELIDAWTIVPDRGTCAIAVVGSWDAGYERAKALQKAYNFKELCLHDRDGQHHETREHRFLRRDITQTGVTFDRSKLLGAPGPAETDGESDESKADGEPDIEYTKPASPSQLGVSVPDVTKVEFVDTDGVLHRYATPWGDGTNAEVAAVAQKYASHEAVTDAFADRLDLWKDYADRLHVAAIYESGTDPTPWVAYRAGEDSLAELGFSFSPAERIDLLADLADVVTTVTDPDHPVCGIQPKNVRLRHRRNDWHLTVANWGIEWAVNAAAGTDYVTPFLSPEQLRGELTDTTGVYQLGAVAFWLLCESPPIDAKDQQHAIRTGQLVTPRLVGGVSADAGPVLQTAMAPDPEDRYATATEFYQALLDAI